MLHSNKSTICVKLTGRLCHFVTISLVNGASPKYSKFSSSVGLTSNSYLSFPSHKMIGQPGSGKSTIIRKLRMQSGRGISNYEKERARSGIWSDMRKVLVSSIRQLEIWDPVWTKIGGIVRNGKERDLLDMLLLNFTPGLSPDLSEFLGHYFGMSMSL